jgi:hypothetical protein
MARCLANCLLLLLAAWSLIAYFFLFSQNYIQSVPPAAAELENSIGPEVVKSNDDVKAHHESVVTFDHTAASDAHTASITSAPSPVHQRQVHAFFYLWYKSVEIDGRWEHWNHRVRGLFFIPANLSDLDSIEMLTDFAALGCQHSRPMASRS